MANEAVLIVDDQPSVRRLLQEVLREEGYTVFMARDGREAVEIARTARPSLVLLDLKMPGMSGVDLMRELWNVVPGIKGIVMTAYSNPETTQRIRELGSIRWIIKPFDLDQVCSLVREILAEPPSPEG